MRLALLALALSVSVAFGADSWSQDAYSKAIYTNTLQSASGVTNIIGMMDRNATSQPWVLTNASVQDYVYWRTTNAFLPRTNSSGVIAAITLMSAVTNNVNLWIFNAPPSATTNGAVWTMDAFGVGATNLAGIVPMSTGYKSGTNHVLLANNVNVTVQPSDGSSNVYIVATWASSTTVTNPPGQYGTNQILRLIGWANR